MSGSFILRGQSSEDERAKTLRALDQAQKEYEVALSCFRESTEPEIIDEAIYLMEAARRKYSYFLKKLRAMAAEKEPSARVEEPDRLAVNR